MRKREPKDYETPLLNRLSREAHAKDVAEYASREPTFRRRPKDRRSEESRAFARKWLGGLD